MLRVQAELETFQQKEVAIKNSISAEEDKIFSSFSKYVRHPVQLAKWSVIYAARHLQVRWCFLYPRIRGETGGCGREARHA